MASATPAAASTSEAAVAQAPHRPLALVTGATSGVGLAVCLDLARDHDLILIARSAENLDALATALTAEAGARVRSVPLDLTDDNAVSAAVARLDLDGLDVIVHSAGVESAGALEDLPPEQWRRVLDLNVVAPAHLTRLLLAPLRRAQGLVVLINSGGGMRVWPGQTVYCASKHALRAFADGLREEERGRVRVTTIYPGRVDTPMQRRLHGKNASMVEGAADGGAGRPYRAADHMTAESVAASVRLAVDMPLDAVVEDLSVRPGQML
ncbi:SDR family oxidoreductase [Actinomyces sp. MRS3W]|nr:SDR family oxidoreductase [Actinomyces sp. MRS3W]MDU0348811.1 SDR family oxidoreductase [Actinomyces sp. MRS3W]